MRYRPLGQSGLLVSVVGLGCNNFGSRLDVDGTRAVVDAAIDAGISLFDTSDTYGGGGGSERALGEVLGSRRDQIVLATKFGGKGVDLGYGPAAGAKGGRVHHRTRPVHVEAAAEVVAAEPGDRHQQSRLSQGPITHIHILRVGRPGPAGGKRAASGP